MRVDYLGKERLSGREAMSIYSTLWVLKFPQFGDFHTGCQWVDVFAEAVPDHIEGARFLPLERGEVDGRGYLAVVIVTDETGKGTPDEPQQYINPLCSLSGAEYAGTSFDALHQRVCDALRRRWGLIDPSEVPKGSARRPNAAGGRPGRRTC